MAADREALKRGDQLIVTCSLKGPAPPYPSRLRQGELELTQKETRWRASWLPWRTPLVLDTPVQSIEVRTAERSEWNLKKGGKAFGLIPIPEFKSSRRRPTTAYLSWPSRAGTCRSSFPHSRATRRGSQAEGLSPGPVMRNDPRGRHLIGSTRSS